MVECASITFPAVSSRGAALLITHGGGGSGAGALALLLHGTTNASTGEVVVVYVRH